MSKYCMLGPILRRYTYLRDSLVHNSVLPCTEVVDKPWGIFRCGSCSECPFIRESAGCMLPDGTWFETHFAVNCAMISIFATWWPASVAHSMWVRPSVPFHKHIHDHIYYTPRINTLFGWHVGLTHKYDARVMKFMALDRVMENPRGRTLTDECYNGRLGGYTA